MKLLKSAALAFAISTSGFAFVTSPAFAQGASIDASVQENLSGTFVKKKKRLKGSWETVQRDGKTFIVFSDNFNAAKGPDLKIFLSPKSIADVTGKTAVDGSINIGVLKRTKGTQEYELPDGVDLSDYRSLLVHCEAYSVLWGGSDL